MISRFKLITIPCNYKEEFLIYLSLPAMKNNRIKNLQTKIMFLNRLINFMKNELKIRFNTKAFLLNKLIHICQFYLDRQKC